MFIRYLGKPRNLATAIQTVLVAVYKAAEIIREINPLVIFTIILIAFIGYEILLLFKICAVLPILMYIGRYFCTFSPFCLI